MIQVTPYEMSFVKYKTWLKKPWTSKSKTKDPNTKQFRTRSGPNKVGHGLVLKNGKYLYCELCDCAVSVKFGQHLAGEIHHDRFEKSRKEVIDSATKEGETQLEASGRFMVDVVNELMKKRAEEDLAGTSLPTSVTMYRMKVHELQLMNNMPATMLNGFKEALDLKGSSLLSIGDARDLSRTIGSALRHKQLRQIRWIMTRCYPAFATCSDGSPLGANAEVLIVRMVRSSDNKIVELLISLRLFEGSLTGEAIAADLLTELRKFDMDLDEWKAAMMDRAANNVLAMKEVKRLTSYRPTFVPCFSHVLSGPGKVFKDKCKELYSFKKALTTAIMFRGKLYLHLKELMNECPVIGSGVRWYIEWEQISQCDKFGIENIIDKLIPYAETKKLSENSVKKMKDACIPTKFPRVIVQAAVVSEMGREFCIATYFTEGQDPLALTEYIILERLDTFVTRGPQFHAGSKTRKKCQEAAALVLELRSGLLDTIASRKEVETELTEEVQSIQQSIETAEEEVANANEQTEARRESRSGRRTTTTNFRELAGGRHRTNNTVDDLQKRIDTLKLQLEAKKVDLNKAIDARKKWEKDLDELDTELDGIITETDFVDHCKEITEAVFDKYKKMMRNEFVHKAQRAFTACKVFDILYLQDGPETVVLERMIDELSNFGFTEFNDPEFINGMKLELKDLLDLANTMPFNFDDEPDTSELYTNRRLIRKRRAAKRHALEMINDLYKENEQQGMDYNIPGVRERLQQIEQDSIVITENCFRNISWKSDAGERSRRIYEWWRVVMNERKTNLPYFRQAIRLVVLTQPSSASAERVFSQLTFIRRIVGDHIVGEMLELRALLRCNNGLREDYTI